MEGNQTTGFKSQAFEDALENNQFEIGLSVGRIVASYLPQSVIIMVLVLTVAR